MKVENWIVTDLFTRLQGFTHYSHTRHPESMVGRRWMTALAIFLLNKVVFEAETVDELTETRRQVQNWLDAKIGE